MSKEPEMTRDEQRAFVENVLKKIAKDVPGIKTTVSDAELDSLSKPILKLFVNGC